MKKSKRTRFIQLIFWLIVAGGALFLALSPAPPKHKLEIAHVKVEQPEEPLLPVATGDEKAEKEATSSSEPLPPTAVESNGGYRGVPRIAIIIDDVGLDLKGSAHAIALPDFVTLSFMPYATRLKEQTKAARDNGHELMLHMPMEPIGHEDPGPGALLVALPPEEIHQRFDTALGSFVGFDGVNNHMGSKFTADPTGMEIVVNELEARHLFFLDSRTSAKSVGEEVAKAHGLPTIARDVFLDDDMALDAVKAQLLQTEHVAKRKGYAVAIGHPHAATLEALEAWIPEAEARGFRFVPVRELIK